MLWKKARQLHDSSGAQAREPLPPNAHAQRMRTCTRPLPRTHLHPDRPIPASHAPDLVLKLLPLLQPILSKFLGVGDLHLGLFELVGLEGP
jgi:hypothetical protein